MSWPLGSRRRWFPGGPIRPDAARTQPLTVHRINSRLRLRLLDKRHEGVAFALKRLRIAYDPAIADLAKRREGFLQRLRLDFRRQIADKYVMMVAGIKLRLIARTGRPVNLHLLVEERAFVHGGQRRSRALMIRKLDEGIRVITGLSDDLASFYRADL